MGYRSQVRIALTSKDFKTLCQQMKEKFGDKNYTMNSIEFQKQDADDFITVFGWDYIKWYDDSSYGFDDIVAIMNFIKNHNSYFVRVGEEEGDIERETYYSKDQEKDPYPEELFESLYTETLIQCNL